MGRISPSKAVIQHCKGIRKLWIPSNGVDVPQLWGIKRGTNFVQLIKEELLSGMKTVYLLTVVLLKVWYEREKTKSISVFLKEGI